MDYSKEQRKILRKERIDGFASGYKKGCCMSIFLCGAAVFLLSFCSNKPINNQLVTDKQPTLVKKGAVPIKKLEEQHTK